jgi:predicted ABC-type ATPase
MENILAIVKWFHLTITSCPAFINHTYMSLRHIITDITASSVGFVMILVFMSVPTFINTVNLYITLNKYYTVV